MRIKALFVAALLAAAAHAQTACNDRLASPVLTVPLPSPPFGVVVSTDGCWVFVSMMNTNGGKGAGIAVLSRKRGRVDLVRTYPLPTPPTGIVLTHDGKLPIAAAIDKVVFLDVPCLISGCTKPNTRRPRAHRADVFARRPLAVHHEPSSLEGMGLAGGLQARRPSERFGLGESGGRGDGDRRGARQI